MDEEVKLETVSLPLGILQAALTCTSTDTSRYYLQGVFVHQVLDEYRIVATDGNRMFVFSQPLEPERQSSKRRKGLPPAEWAKKGVIIPSDGLKERLALLAKLEVEMVDVTFGVGQLQMYLHDRPHACRFRLTPVDGVFPDYQRVIDNLKSFEAHEVEDLHSVAFDQKYLAAVGALGKLLKSGSVRLHSSTTPSDPQLITFPDCEGAVLVLIPVMAPKQIAGGAARVLSGSVAGSVAALRAHRTRWASQLEQPNISAKTREGIEAKVKEYDDRITALLDGTNGLPALPAPDRPAEPEGGPVPMDALGEGWVPPPVEPTPEPETDKGIIAQQRARAALKGKARDRARLSFVADINAALSKEDAGFTVNQLADGVPIDDWFDTGMPASNAAIRCHDWRMAKDVLPEDQIPEGDGDKPVALVRSRLQVEAPAPVEPPPTPEAAKKPAKTRAQLAKAIANAPAPEPEPTPAPVARPKVVRGKVAPPAPRGRRKAAE